jgi:hypothetical protein
MHPRGSLAVNTSPTDADETDPRFPSGAWVGFLLQKHARPGRYPMRIRLSFRGGTLTGEGEDFVGRFTFHGSYDLGTGGCVWVKQYLGRHAVNYRGFNEGAGIWGMWEMPEWGFSGGFHIWPEDMPDPSQPRPAAVGGP